MGRPCYSYFGTSRRARSLTSAARRGAIPDGEAAYVV
jgi:hypothetical protein